MTSNQTCPYAVLNVTQDATIEEIRRSYKKLAIQHHPDKNQGKPEATTIFQRISGAYAILSDEEKRRHYDMTGSLDENDSGFDVGNMDDLIRMFFGSVGGGMFSGGYMDHFMIDGDSFDEDSDDYFDEEEYMEDLMEVIPGLFCEHFIEAFESGKKQHVSYRCTLCQCVMRTPEAAEMHFVHNHALLVSKFISVIQRMNVEDDVEDLFDEFAEKVRNGEIRGEKKKRKPVRRGPTIAPNKTSSKP